MSFRGSHCPSGQRILPELSSRHSLTYIRLSSHAHLLASVTGWYPLPILAKVLLANIPLGNYILFQRSFSDHALPLPKAFSPRKPNPDGLQWSISEPKEMQPTSLRCNVTHACFSLPLREGSVPWNSHSQADWGL